jgi:hypothetical protein
MVISNVEYEEGLRRLESEQPILRADLRLYATVGWMRPASSAASQPRMPR